MAEETKTIGELRRGEEKASISDITREDYKSDDGTPVKVLKYPISDINRYGARVTFTPMLIIGPTFEGDVTIADFLKVAVGSLASIKSASDFSKKDEEKVQENLNENAGKGPIMVKGVKKPLTMKKIDIYLPISFNATDTLTYDSPSIGSSGAILSNALDNASGSAGTAVGGAVEDFIKLFTGAGSSGVNGLAQLGVSKLANRGPTEIGEGVASSLRVTADPNIRTLFRNVQVRQFAFQFKFIAKNAEEAREIKNIIKRLRFYAYPESIRFGMEKDETGKEDEYSGVSVGFKYPHPFKISTSYLDPDGNVTRIGPKMKYCYLTSITTNYNPTTMAFHEDGEPVEIDLSLNFTEETTLNKRDILDHY